MKQKIYILGLITTLIIFTGAMFKVNHWPGAGYMIIIGMVTLVIVFIPVALVNNYKVEGNRQNTTLYIVTWLTCFVVFGGMLFKIMHWPGAGYALIVALPFPYVVFLPVYLVVTSRNKNFNIYNTVYVLFLLSVVSVFSVLLALSVPKDRINDSMGLSRNYNKLEMILDENFLAENNTPVEQKIDSVLKIVNDYQSLIFKQNRITEEQWNNDPTILSFPESGDRAQQALWTGKGDDLDTRLETGLKRLISEIGVTQGCENLAKAAPAIFDFKGASEEADSWTGRIFRANPQMWVLIYLDGLETNLKMIKVTLASTTN